MWACDATPLTPPTDGGSLIPDAAFMHVADASTMPAQCQENCFAPDCYDLMPEECCTNENVVILSEMRDIYSSENTCNGPLDIGGGISIHVGGGCDASGILNYSLNFV